MHDIFHLPIDLIITHAHGAGASSDPDALPAQYIRRQYDRSPFQTLRAA
jgi:hypothetical protein